jgi:phage terminase large subunit-like protein
VVWLDEEAPLDIYAEAVVRTMVPNGLLITTFTPLNGLSETVMNFAPEGTVPKDQVPVNLDELLRLAP